MIAKLKAWIITIASALLVIVYLGTWAVLERKAKQFQERRARRAEALARAERLILNTQAAKAEKEAALQNEVDAAIAGAEELRRRADKQRQEAKAKANDPQLSLLDWLDQRFTD